MNSTFGAEWPQVAAGCDRSFWSQVLHVPTTGSTNADLALAARQGAPHGTVLVADHQSGGRGRLDRQWTAPAGTSLAISVLLRPPATIGVARWLWLPLVAGLAVADAVSTATGLTPQLKWPNDVLLDGGKLCGILSERVVADGGAAVVIGMGVNTTLASDQLPVPTATSLALAGAQVSDEDLVIALLEAVQRWYQRWETGVDLSGVLTQRCSTIGRSVRVELGEAGAVCGTATGIDADGRLLVQTADGVRAFAAGDVVHLR